MLLMTSSFSRGSMTRFPVTVIDGLLVEEHHNTGNDGGEEYQVDKDHCNDHDGQKKGALVPPGDQPGGKEEGDLLFLKHRCFPFS